MLGSSDLLVGHRCPWCNNLEDERTGYLMFYCVGKTTETPNENNKKQVDNVLKVR